MKKVDCEHPTDEAQTICTHVFKWATPHDGVKRFTGQGNSADYLCEKCASQPFFSSKTVCHTCVKKLEALHSWRIRGQPGIRYTPKNFNIQYRNIHIGDFMDDPVSSLIEFNRSPDQALVFTRSGKLYQLNILDGSHRLLAEYADSGLCLAGKVSMQLSIKNEYAAITTRSRKLHTDIPNTGIVIRVDTGDILMRLDQGDYHTELTEFPVTFIQRLGKTYVVHATDWNTVDITEPETQQCLTRRDANDSPCKDIDNGVFTERLGTLLVSPDQTSIATIGWIWHPVGIAFSWNIDEWFSNPWEPDCGASKVSYAMWDYFWYSPFFWLDNHRLCIWGYEALHTDEDIPLNSVAIYNADTGDLINWFSGPTMDVFYYDKYLFSGSCHENTLSIWDIETGALLYEYQDIIVNAYHCGSRELISIQDNGVIGFYHWKEAE